MTMLTQEYVRSRYDYADGNLIAKFNKGKVKAGDVIGTTGDKDGYLRASVHNKPVNVHRLIFLWHHGYLPKIVDHINGDNQDNRIENLRESDAKLNANNKRKHREGIPAGVSWHNRDQCWQAYRYEGRKRTNLGYFRTMEEAASAVRVA